MTNETCNDRPAATDELSDEALAKIAYDAMGEDSVRDQVAAVRFDRIARAVRAALTPDVPPLGPGETVRIADQEGGWIEVASDEDFPHLLYVTNDAWLDAAGVAALADVCRRWQRAQEDDQ